LRPAFESQRDLDVGFRQRIGVDIDLDVDLRLLTRHQRTRRVRVLEREILDVLRQNAELRLRSLGGAAIGRRHAISFVCGGFANTAPRDEQGWVTAAAYRPSRSLRRSGNSGS